MSHKRTWSQKERRERRGGSQSASADVEEKGEERRRGGRILVRRARILFSELPAAEILVDPEGMGVWVGDAEKPGERTPLRNLPRGRQGPQPGSQSPRHLPASEARAARERGFFDNLK